MPWIFEIKDKSGRKIHLSKERWSHISQEHPEVADYFEEIKETIKNQTQIATYSNDKYIRYYYKYFKNRQSPAKYLLLIGDCYLNPIDIYSLNHKKSPKG